MGLFAGLKIEGFELGLPGFIGLLMPIDPGEQAVEHPSLDLRLIGLSIQGFLAYGTDVTETGPQA